MNGTYQGVYSRSNFKTDDICGNNIEHGERYLITGGNGEGPEKRICVNCCLEKKYAKYVVEKGEKVLTFLIDEPLPKAEDTKKIESAKKPEDTKKPEATKKTEAIKKTEDTKAKKKPATNK